MTYEQSTSTDKLAVWGSISSIVAIPLAIGLTVISFYWGQYLERLKTPSKEILLVNHEIPFTLFSPDTSSVFELTLKHNGQEPKIITDAIRIKQISVANTGTAILRGEDVLSPLQLTTNRPFLYALVADKSRKEVKVTTDVGEDSRAITVNWNFLENRDFVSIDIYYVGNDPFEISHDMTLEKGWTTSAKTEEQLRDEQMDHEFRREFQFLRLLKSELLKWRILLLPTVITTLMIFFGHRNPTDSWVKLSRIGKLKFIFAVFAGSFIVTILIVFVLVCIEVVHAQFLLSGVE